MLIQHDEKIVVGGCVQKTDVAKQQLSLTRYLSGNNSIATLKHNNIAAIKKGSLYPNPVKDVLHINGLNEKVLTIVNIHGYIVKRLVANSNAYNLNVSNLAAGIYYLKVEDSDNEIYKFVKE